MTETAYERVTHRLAQVTGWQPPNERAGWRCPAHEDNSPSLSVSRGQRGVVLKCQAGCDTTAVIAALDLTMGDLFDEAPKTRADKPEVVATYDYTDEDGQLLYQVLRMVPKTFRQRRPMPGGEWQWSIADTRRVLYRLPRVIAAAQRGDTIFVVEGEKDVHAIESAGATATCNAGGAGKWLDEYSRILAGADIVIVADKDGPGYQHAHRVAASLQAAGCTVTITQAATGKDAADHLAAGHTLDDLELYEPAGAEDAPDTPPVVPNLLDIQWARDHAHDVDSQPPIGWLIRGVWPGDAHGVLAAEQKAGKTWANLDLAVSVASGTPWMGVYPIDTAGPVVLFLGEGGKRKMLRRLRAICEHRGVRYEDLPIRVCFKVPHLTSDLHLAAIAEEVDATRPALVVIDPLYLAARGAKTSQLNEMGEHLENIQHVAMRHGAALAIIHHWNKTGEGKGAKRMTGAGGAEWGRVLVSVSIITKHTDRDTMRSSVVLDWDFEGDEIADLHLRVKRSVWTDNPDDLNSPMHYEVEELADDLAEDVEHPGLSPSARRVLKVLDDAEGEWMLVGEVGDKLADGGRPLKKRTIQQALKDLAAAGLAIPAGESTEAYRWRGKRKTDE
jgi:5S rRNA maturation endonuclease (ribonuclease M5)